MRPLAPQSGVHPHDGSGTDAPTAAASPAAATVVTRMNFAAAPAQVWDVLMFYEEIEVPPPVLLRLLLPLPIRTEGSKQAVGDVAMCLYEGGHLRKRVTHIEPGRYYGFEVVEQHLAVGNGLLLTGGSYALRELPSRRTEVAVTTHYVSRKRPAWLWKPIEATVCHMFHRHLLKSMRHRIESG
jgi:hypothetical protein